MTKIKREEYLKKIRPWYEDEQIKIISGLRRTGKSELLRQIMDELKEKGVRSEKILYYNFESFDFSYITSAFDFDRDVKSKINDDSKYYLFCDEIQNIPDFEKAINSLRTTENISIFITGSNSRLLSTELSTDLSGRFVSFFIQPFSFNEVVEYSNCQSQNYDELLNNIMKWGSLPHRFDLVADDQIETYLSDVYDSIVARDIVLRLNVRNLNLFHSIFSYMVENIGNEFSLKKIINTLKSSGRKISNETIYEYIHNITSSLLLRRVDRYNIAGKAILQNRAKYYATDLGLSQIKIAKSKQNICACLENIVYLHLIRKGYEVYVGNLDSGEIDFVAIKNNEIEYYQVTTYLEGNDDLIAREFGAFTHINDYYPRFILSLDKTDMSRNGIKNLNIVKWLLSDEH